MKKFAVLLGVCAVSVAALAADLADVNRDVYTTEPGLKALVRAVQDNFTDVNTQLASIAAGTGSTTLPVAKVNFGGTYVTNVVVSADAKTNTIVLEGKSIKSWTVTQ